MIINDFFTYVFSMHWILASRPFDVILMLIMFSIGLASKSIEKQVLSRPIKYILITFILLYLINPLMTLAFTILLDLNTKISFCLLLISSCLGGRYLPIFTFLGQGDVKLSLISHCIINFLTLLTTPLVLSCLFYLHPKFENYSYLNLYAFLPKATFLVISFTLPYIAGILFATYFPMLTDTLYKPIRNINSLVMVIMMIMSIGLNISSYHQQISFDFIHLVIYSTLLLLTSYSVGRLSGLPTKQLRSLTLTGIMGNYALLYFLIINFFPGESFYIAFIGTWGHIFLLQSILLVLIWNIKMKSSDVRNT